MLHFSRSVGVDGCFHEKVGGRFAFGIYTGASSATVDFQDVFGAVGLVSERVVCADAATLCVRPCYWYLPCRVDRITVSFVVQRKLSKDSRNKKLNTYR